MSALEITAPITEAGDGSMYLGTSLTMISKCHNIRIVKNMNEGFKNFI
jgi:hypothetical protein